MTRYYSYLPAGRQYQLQVHCVTTQRLLCNSGRSIAAAIAAEIIDRFGGLAVAEITFSSPSLGFLYRHVAG